MKFGQVVLIVCISIVAAVGSSTYIVKHQSGAEQQTAHESAYERVLRTGTLRCGYADFPPHLFIKDPNTGKFSGIFVDVMDAVAGKLNLKVEWTENTGWAGLVESLRTHRVDAFCAGKWRDAARGRYIAYGAPLFYMAVYPYVRANDHRFDHDLSLVDEPKVKISALDGEMSDLIAKQHFPKAQEVAVPQMGQMTDIFTNVIDKKADIVFNDSSIAAEFIKANPGKLRPAQANPYQVFPTSLAVDVHEQQLLAVLDSALSEMQNTGAIDEIISKYSMDPTVFLHVAKPYQSQ